MVYYQPPSPQIYEDPPHERWRQRLVLMWWGFWLLAALVAAWLVFDYFYWSIRLPQDRVLTNKQGEAMPVRIEGRAPGILKLIRLSDGSSHLYPTINLVEADQEFVARLPIMLSFKYPLDYEFTDADGRHVMARLEGRTKDLLKWVSRKDNLTHWTALDSLPAADQALALSLPATLQMSYPLEAEFTDKQGHSYGVNIEGRSSTMVKFARLPEDMEQTLPLADLSPADQAFVGTLPANLASDYPFDRTLTDKAGHSFQASIEGRSDTMVKFTRLPDGTTETALLADLSAVDQAFLGKLSANLDNAYPLERTLTDKAGHSFQASIEGRSSTMVKFTRSQDGTTETALLADLSPADQAFLGSLPANLANDYPLDRTLTDKLGHAFPVSVQGRSDAMVKVTMTKDGTMQLIPLADLSPADQAFLGSLPVNLTFDYPQEWTMTDQRGRSVQVNIEGRTPEVVKIVVLEDGKTHLYPIATLSQKDQAFVQSLPVNLTLQYPLKSSLMDQQGHTLQVTIVGRSDDEVQFTRDGDGKTYTYPLTKLSDADRAYVLLLPLKWQADTAAPSAPESIELKNMRERVSELRGQITDLNTQASGTDASQMQRDLMVNEMKSRQSEMDDLMVKILSATPEAATGSNANSPAPADWRQQIADLQQRIANVRATLAKGPPKTASATFYPRWRDQLNGELSSAEAQLNHLYDEAGSTGQ